MNEPLMTDLDRRLQEIAAKNWPQFVALIGSDPIIAAKICLLRQQKKSYGEIMVKLNVSKQTVRTNCKKCDDEISC